jgi:hypothetical protein
MLEHVGGTRGVTTSSTDHTSDPSLSLDLWMF